MATLRQQWTVEIQLFKFKFLCQCDIISPGPPDKSVYRPAYSSSPISSIQFKMMFKIDLRIVMANEYFTSKKPGKRSNKQQFKIGMLRLSFSPHLSIYFCENVTFDSIKHAYFANIHIVFTYGALLVLFLINSTHFDHLPQ